MILLKQWRIVLIICVAAIAIPIAAHVRQTQTELVEPARVNLYQPTAAYTEVATTVRSGKTSVGYRITPPPPQRYYDRRRRYLEDRIERRADALEEEDGNDEDDANSDDGQDSKNSASDDDEGDSMDDEEELVDRRREYLRERLDRRWD